MTLGIDTERATAAAHEARRIVEFMERMAVGVEHIGPRYGVESWTRAATAKIADTADAIGAISASVRAHTGAAVAVDQFLDGIFGSLPGWGGGAHGLFGSADPADPADPGVAGAPHFVLGPPTRPHIGWDEDFIYDSKSAGWRDFLAREKWQAKLTGAKLLRSDLDDAVGDVLALLEQQRRPDRLRLRGSRPRR